MATRSPAKTMYSGAPALEAARQAFRSAFAAGSDRLFLSAFAAGSDRLFLWIPVVFGVGIGTYFGLAEEPDRFVGPLATALCAIAAIVLRRAGKAGFVLPAALAVAGLVNSYWVMVAMFALMGVGNTVYHPADYSLLSRHVAAERVSQAYSIHTFCGLLGSAAAPGTITQSGSVEGTISVPTWPLDRHKSSVSALGLAPPP